MTATKEPAILAMLRAHIARGDATRMSCAVLYAMAIANYGSMRQGDLNHWSTFNTLIVDGLKLKSIRHLDWVKREAWTLYELTVAQLGLPASAPKP